MPVDPSELTKQERFKYYSSYLILRGVIGAMRLLPYRRRIPAMGKLVSLIAPLAGYRKRIRNNLAIACPDLPKTEVDRLCRAVPDTAGRAIMELFSAQEFVAHNANAPISGPGFAAFEKARAEGRPAIMITGHFGNYDAGRVALRTKGHEIGALYRRMANPYFNEIYVQALNDVGKPMFEQGRRGMMEMVRSLKKGGTIAIVSDLHAHGGKELTFFGQPAVTSIVPTELALKYNAIIIPVYAVRQPNGLDFHIRMFDPVEHSDAITMAQQVNDGLEQMVRDHMEQWFWIHRRWKPWMGLGLQPPENGS